MSGKVIYRVYNKKATAQKNSILKRVDLYSRNLLVYFKEGINPEARLCQFGLVRHNYHKPQGLINLVRFKQVQRMVSNE